MASRGTVRFSLRTWYLCSKTQTRRGGRIPGQSPAGQALVTVPILSSDLSWCPAGSDPPIPSIPLVCFAGQTEKY